MTAAPDTPSPRRFLPVALEHASRLINHGPTVLVTATHAGRRNVMAAAWSMPVEFTPPRIAVVIDKHCHTRELAAASGVFGLVIPGVAFLDRCYAVGSVSGREFDKFERYGIEAHAGAVTGVPLIESGCAAWLECRLIPEPHTEDAYDTCFAEVLAAAADPRVFHAGHWEFRADNRELHTIHHLGGGHFAPAGETLTARPL